MLGSLTVTHPTLDWKDPAGIPNGIADMAKHDELLAYIKGRLDQGKVIRDNRIQRFARIDRAVSTWQILDEEDRKRDEREQTTGTPQAIKSTIPLIHSHLEDLVSFYAGVYSPNAGNFFALPKPEESAALSALVEKMNADSKYCGYYNELTTSIRTLLKYNVGGFHCEWGKKAANNAETIPAGNRIHSLDMYNLMWDPAVKDPAKIRSDAEWAAMFSVKNRWWLVKEAKANGWWGIDAVAESDKDMYRQSNSGKKTASYYRYPPDDARIGIDEGTTATDQLDSYFQGLQNSVMPEIYGHEIGIVYIRLNPDDWNLLSVDEALAQDDSQLLAPEYQLWRFVIVDGTQICHASRVDMIVEEIPIYAARLHVDEMGDATKSVAELLKGFQSFISFLFNIHVLGARGNIWGFIGVNPQMFDTTRLKAGDVAGVLEMKGPAAAANIDPQLGIRRIQSNAAETAQTIPMIQGVMNLLQNMFPSQSLPAQIASIDRAVQNQVAAVLQGVNRRLHMLAHLLDNQSMSPLRMRMYYNTGQNADGELKAKLVGLTHDGVVNALGSGLKEMNREAATMAFKEILMALIQSPQTIVDNRIQLIGMIDYWADLMDIDIDMTQFQAPAPQQPPVSPDGQGAASGPGADQAAQPAQNLQ